MSGFRDAFPILHVEDVEAAVGFYRETFGCEETFRHEEEGRPVYAFLRLEPLGLGVALRSADEERDFALWVHADDVDEAAARLRAAGAEEVLAPTDQPWRERLCSFVAPNLLHVGSRR